MPYADPRDPLFHQARRHDGARQLNLILGILGTIVVLKILL